MLLGSKPTLEEILSNSSISPYSLHDFRNYLFYYEHTLENLEFLFWYDHYLIRYNQKQYNKRYKLLVDASNLPNSILTFLPIGELKEEERVHNNTILMEDELVEFCKKESPFSDELQDVLNLFLIPNSPMELNLPYSIKKGVILNNYLDTNPERLSPIANHCYEILNQSYNKFIVHNKKLKCKCNTFRRLSPSIFLYLVSITMLACFIVFKVNPYFRLLVIPLLFLANLLPFITVQSSCPIQLVNQFKHLNDNCSNNKKNDTDITATEKSMTAIPGSPISQWGKDPFYKYLLNQNINTVCKQEKCSLFKDPYKNSSNIHIPSLSCTLKFRFFVYAFILTAILVFPIYFIPAFSDEANRIY